MATTRGNLITAINQGRNEGKHAIFARELENSTIGGFPMQSLGEEMIELIHDGSYPVISDVNVTLSTTNDSTLITDELLGLVDANTSSGTLSLDLRKLSDLGPILEVRVVGLDGSGNASYSEPRTFEVRDQERAYVEMVDPISNRNIGRRAVLHHRSGGSRQ